MLHKIWHDNHIKDVEVIHTNAKKFKVSDMLTIGKTYPVVNETEEYLFIIDDSNKVGRYFKEYFKEV